MFRLILIATTVVAGWSGVPTLRAQTLHALVIADLSPWAGWGKYAPAIQGDAAILFFQLHSQIPPQQLNYHSLQMFDNRASDPAAIREALAEITVRPQDTLLVYFTGHGSHDDQGHYFDLAQGKLYRSDLKALMETKAPRLNVLLTDSCDLRSDGEDFFAPFLMPIEPATASPLFRSLFFTPEGWVDINSSAPNEASFVGQLRDEELPGSLFTSELNRFWERHQHRPSTWDLLVREVSIGVSVAFQANYPKGAMLAKGSKVQTAQNVYPLAYPGMPPQDGPRSGLVVRDHPGGGALITEVTPGYPGQRVFDIQAKVYGTLRAGQVIINVNGQPIADAEAFAVVVRRSPQIMRLTIVSGERTGEVLARLRY